MHPKRKHFFAQNSICDAFGHRAKYFYTLEEAIEWLKLNHGGTVKKRIWQRDIIEGQRYWTWGEIAEVVGDCATIYEKPRVASLKNILYGE